jgi:hypothetical protein
MSLRMPALISIVSVFAVHDTLGTFLSTRDWIALWRILANPADDRSIRDEAIVSSPITLKSAENT